MPADSPLAFLPTGAIIQRFEVAGHNIVLGFPSPEPYLDAPFFGETIGRVANRIKDGVIDSLNGRSYQIPQNQSPNHLHGGNEGWGKKLFSGPHQGIREGKECVQFIYVSPDGDEGYPGTVELRVWYTVAEEDDHGVRKTVLQAEYEVEFTGDECEETTVNVTNHSYFNISDLPIIDGTQCTLSTSKHLPVDETSIPLGTIADFPGIQANVPFVLGQTEPKIDHCFVVDKNPSGVPLDTRKEQPRLLVSLSHPNTKLHLDVFSTEPAFQFYTGDLIDKIPATEKTRAYGPRSGLCIEPSRYINAINVPEWRKQSLLPRGQLWGSRTVYKAWKA